MSVHLSDRFRFLDENVAFKDAVIRQLERMHNTDPDLCEVLNLGDLHYVQLAVFCHIVECHFDALPNTFNASAVNALPDLTQISVEDYFTEIDKESGVSKECVAQKLAYIKKSEHTAPIKKRLAQLFLLLRKNPTQS